MWKLEAAGESLEPTYAFQVELLRSGLDQGKGRTY